MKTILVPVDFSSTSLNAAKYAVALARDMESEVILFHAYHVPTPIRGAVIVPEEEVIEESWRAMQEFMEQLDSSMKDRIHHRIREGHAVHATHEAMHETGAELAVIGITGAGAVAEKLVGSNTLRLVKETDFPVIIVPPKAQYQRPENIVLATSFTETEYCASFSILRTLHERFGSKLVVLNIVTEDEESPIRDAVSAIKLEHSISGIEHTVNFTVAETVEEGLNAFAKQAGAQLIAMVPGKKKLFQRLLHPSHTKRMAFHAVIPIITLPSEVCKGNFDDGPAISRTGPGVFDSEE